MLDDLRLISGYLSRIAGKDTYVLEDRCLGKGDAACHLFGRSREEWGEDCAEQLIFFEPSRLKECLDVSLQRVTQTLKAAERMIVSAAPEGRRRPRRYSGSLSTPAPSGSSWPSMDR